MIEIVKYIFRRIVSLVPVLLIISFLSFSLMSVASGDPVERLLTSQGTVVTPEVLEAVRSEMGLDQPFHVQYFNWLKNALRGDLGNSYGSGMKVSKELMDHLPYTIALTTCSMALSLVVSVPLGILSAIKKNRFTDYLIRFFTFIGNAIPGFLLGLILLLVFSLKLRWLPILSGSGVKSIILPSVTLSFAIVSKYIRQIRAAVLEELNKNYVRGARSRGVREGIILYRNVLKNIMVTVITLTGLSVGSLLGGSAVVESIFLWPGTGSMVVTAIANRDYLLIQGYVLVMGVVFVTVNLITDILYRVVDPRVRER